MSYHFYINSESEHGEVHIYEDRSFFPLCGDHRVSADYDNPLGLYLGKRPLPTGFKENGVRTFAAILENNGLPVCGTCISKLYRTKSNQRLLSNYPTDY